MASRLGSQVQQQLVVLGESLPGRQFVKYALTRFKHIGLSTATTLCDKASIHKHCRVSDLNEVQTRRLRELLADVLEQNKSITLKRLREDQAARSIELPYSNDYVRLHKRPKAKLQ